MLNCSQQAFKRRVHLSGARLPLLAEQFQARRQVKHSLLLLLVQNGSFLH